MKRKMQNPYFNCLDSPQKIKNRFLPIQFKDKIEIINEIYTFRYANLKDRCLFIRGKSKFMLGIIIAKNSSDIMVKLMQKIILDVKQTGNFLIQYNIYASVPSLILLTDFVDYQNFDIYVMSLLQKYEIYNQKMDKLISSL